MNIIGNTPPDSIGYLNYLNDLVRQCGLEDFVRFEMNIRFDRLLDPMLRSKVYVHPPTPGEPFSTSTVEAMSAGIIPAVPDMAGHTEFVPARYQFHTYGKGVQAAEALADPISERIKLSYSTQKYSVTNYIKIFQQILFRVTDIGKKLLESKPIISLSKGQPESTTA